MTHFRNGFLFSGLFDIQVRGSLNSNGFYSMIFRPLPEVYLSYLKRIKFFFECHNEEQVLDFFDLRVRLLVRAILRRFVLFTGTLMSHKRGLKKRDENFRLRGILR